MRIIRTIADAFIRGIDMLENLPDWITLPLAFVGLGFMLFFLGLYLLKAGFSSCMLIDMFSEVR